MIGPVTNNRRFERFDVNLKARAVGREGEFDATVTDISEGGAAIAAPPALFTNDSFVDLHVTGYDHYKGRVVREFSGGYALEFEHTEAEQKRMHEAIKEFEAVAGKGKPLDA